MSTFSKITFNASVYAAGRPTYPVELFDRIFEYHREGSGTSALNPARWERAVDVGCGTGQATTHLKGLFERVSCVDPSAAMLRKAREYLLGTSAGTPPSTAAAATNLAPRSETAFSFHCGSAEDLGEIITEGGSVDLIIAAQACHWFDWSKVWPETRRVLRKGGTAAFWVYGEIRLSAFPSLAPLITAYAQGTDPTSTSSVGAHFQRPGRTILERLLVDVPSPAAVLRPETPEGNIGLGDFRRVYFADPHSIPSPNSGSSPDPKFVYPVLMRAQWRWVDLLGYLHTWSALHSYHERFPEDLQREEDSRFLAQDLADIAGRPHPTEASTHPEKGTSNPDSRKPVMGEVEGISVRGGDIAIRFWKNLREAAGKELSTASRSPASVTGIDSGLGLFDMVTIEWPVAMLLVRRV